MSDIETSGEQGGEVNDNFDCVLVDVTDIPVLSRLETRMQNKEHSMKV